MNIGPWQFHAPQSSDKLNFQTPPIFLAPMAGITDRPFRQLCRKLGAAQAISEMVTSKPELMHSLKTQTRLNHDGESPPIAVQILGTEAQQMAQAAQFNVLNGADIIDINMGCPAKKVCNVLAGSALLKNELLVRDILSAVVQSVPVPVTLKIRTGWDKNNKNAVNIAQIAEDVGIQALTIHGRTRACGYRGEVEYDTIKTVKQQVSIPIIANGDINSAEKAQHVLQYTGADAIMIGRAAVPTPWIFADINYFLAMETHLPEPSVQTKSELILGLLNDLYSFYGESHGVRIARKHLIATVKPMPGGEQFWKKINRIDNAHMQFTMTKKFLDSLS
ncbi:MAG: tRNA dihydrouridine synthase DusB [Gammaproteobacteria bacterium]|nr:tRNA dihydrouridine synthase DusB [Gammaproteobacteria bacterium]